MKNILSSLLQIVAIALVLAINSISAAGQSLPAAAGPINGGNPYFCLKPEGATLTHIVSPIANASSYFWYVAGGEIISGQSTNTVIVKWAAGAVPTRYISVAGENSSGRGTEFRVNMIAINTPGAAGPINGPALVSPGDRNIRYSIGAVPNASYLGWSVPDGMSHNGIQYEASGEAYILANISNTFAGGTMSVTGQYQQCSGTTSTLSVKTLPGAAGPINGGNPNFCLLPNGATETYRVDPIANATSYIWSAVGGEIISEQSTNTVIVKWAAGAVPARYISVAGQNNSGRGTESLLNMTAINTPGDAGPIIGPTSVGPGDRNIRYSVGPIPNASYLSWVVPDGMSHTGIQYGPAGEAYIIANISNACAGGTMSVTGHHLQCRGTTSTLSIRVPGKTIPEAAGPINGDRFLCFKPGGLTVTYSIDSIPNASSYSWNVVGGRVIGGQSTTRVNVEWNSVVYPVRSISVAGVNGLGMGTPSSLEMAVHYLPGAAGPINNGNPYLCLRPEGATETYQVDPINNATSYSWSVVGGQIISGQSANKVIVKWAPGTLPARSIRVSGINCAGIGTSSSLDLSVMNTPNNVGLLDGPRSICSTNKEIPYRYAVFCKANANLGWSVPNGMSHSGVQYDALAGQAYIFAKISDGFTGGTMSVVELNGPCSSTPSTLNISYSPIPPSGAGLIEGDALILPGQTAAAYSVPSIANAGVYEWTLPPKASIVSGANTSSVVVYFTTAFDTGTVSVRATNCKGAGASSSFNVSRGPEPTTAEWLLKSNAVRADIIKVPGITADYQITNDISQTSISYMDGLGRPYQRLAVRASGSGAKDLVEFMRYDQFGLQPKAYLPYAASGRNEKYRPDAIAEHAAFYSTAGDAIADDAFPYAITTYDASPLNRVLEMGSPGADWQPGQHTIKPIIRLNTRAENIRIWTPAGPSAIFYETAELSVNEVPDENGNKVIEYTNGIGQVVLKKVQAGATTWLETVYVYNELGNLICQVPPEAVKAVEAAPASAWTASLINKWVLTYTYDSKGRLVEKKAPGAEPVYMVYDRYDRLVLTQDGNLRTATPVSSRWYFTKFDVLHRTVLEGIYSYQDFYPTLTLTPREKLQKYLDETAFASYFEQRAPGTTYGYSNLAFPTAINDANVLAINYYDDYNFDNDASGSPDYSYIHPNSMGSGYLENATSSNSIITEGMPTGTKKRVMGASGWIIEVIFYDEYGNAIQKRSNNLLNQSVNDIASNGYDTFTGKLLATKQVKLTTSMVTVVNKLGYDSNDRPTQITMSINGGADQVLAKYEYNELGQLKDKKLHKKADGNFLQSVDFRYSIRGWLTNINNSKLNADGDTNDDTDDIFGMTILRNTTDAALGNSAAYNGNITAIKWQTGDRFAVNNVNFPQRERSYKFTYDKADRLMQANYAALTGSAWSVETGAYDEGVTYDLNGNIKTLQRYTKDNETTPRFLIDNLTYDYASGNQLSKVSDATANTLGFKDGANTINEYTYDLNGNLLADANKGITNTYNDLNKISKVVLSASQQVEYIYDASGARIRKKVTNGANITTYDYIDGFVYRNSSLNYFSTAEGKVRVSGTTYTYEYFIQDHLGNVRVSFEDNGSGLARVVQENHYYPFGLTIKGINRTPVPSEKNLFLFNGGSELQDDFGFEHSYSTFFREYDPVLGRFNGIDPMVDKYGGLTPYNFAFNDPVNFNDPTGADPGDGRSLGTYDYYSNEFVWQDPNGMAESYARLGMGHIYADGKYISNYMANVQSRMERQYEQYKISSGYVKTSQGDWVERGDLNSYVPKEGIAGHWGPTPRQYLGMFEGQVIDRARPDLRTWIPGTIDWVEVASTAADFAGYVPGLNIVSGVVGAGIDIYRGDYGSAALNLLTVVPGAKYAVAATALAGTVMTGLKTVRKIQKHHVIPNKLYKLYKNDLKAIGWLQDAGLNLKKLPTPFHGNHPAYTNYVEEQILLLKQKGKLDLQSMKDLQHQLRQEINTIYLNGGSKLNDFYKALGY